MILLYVWYIIFYVYLVDTFKGWHQTTETKTIWCILEIFKQWGINIKSHFLCIFGIFNLNYKYFKLIFILCFIMTLLDCIAGIRLICAKFFFDTIKIKIKPTLWYYRLTLELECILIFSFFSYLQIFQLIMYRFQPKMSPPISFSGMYLR